MVFFNSTVDVLRTLVVALGAGLGIWGSINLLEGRGSPVATSALTSAEAPTELAGENGNDNPGARSSLKGLRDSLGRRHEAVDGRRWCCHDWHHLGTTAFRSLRLIQAPRSTKTTC